MKIDRRTLLAAGSVALAACGARFAPSERGGSTRLDALLAANADVLPERAGAGANHYPMAGEVLETLGRSGAIPEGWISGATGYAGDAPRSAPIGDGGDALGDPARYGDWLDLFRAEIARDGGEAVVARWVPVLAPGLSGGAFHGLIRTAHAYRALSRIDGMARRSELAAGLAYWASGHAELGTRTDGRDLPLHLVEHPWLDASSDVDFFGVTRRLTEQPIAPPLREDPPDVEARDALAAVVREAAAGFLEMLVQERHRIWMLHAVTAPASVELLLPALEEGDARALVAHARRAVSATFVAFGAPYEPRTSVRAEPGSWDDHVARAVASDSVHTLKLIEALRRFDRGDDPLLRSVAAEWFDWS
ncbi:MAG: hypothetical protein AAGB93_20325 [Planctomycetota bacterium]